MGIVDRIRKLNKEKEPTSIVERVKNLNKPLVQTSKLGGGTSSAIAPTTFGVPDLVVQPKKIVEEPKPPTDFSNVNNQFIQGPTDDQRKQVQDRIEKINAISAKEEQRKKSLAGAEKRLEFLLGENKRLQKQPEFDFNQEKALTEDILKTRNLISANQPGFKTGIRESVGLEPTAQFGAQLATPERAEAKGLATEEARRQKGFTTGRVLGEVGKQFTLYATVGKAIEGALLGGRVAKGGLSLSNQFAQNLVDTVIQRPQDVADNIKAGKPWYDGLHKKVLLDMGINLGIGAGENLVKSLSNVNEREIVEEISKQLSPEDAKTVRDTLGTKPTAFEPKKLGPTQEQPIKGAIDTKIPLSPTTKSFQPPTKNVIDDFQAWRSKNFGGATGKQSPEDIKTIRDLYFEDTGKYISDVDLKTFTKSQGELAFDATRKRFPVIEPKEGLISAPSVNPIVDRVKNLSTAVSKTVDNPIVNRIKALQPNAVKVAESTPIKETITDTAAKAIKEEPSAIKEVVKPATPVIKTPEVGTSKSKFTQRLENVFKDDPSAEVLVKEIKKIDKLATTTDATRIDLAKEIIDRDFAKALDIVKTGDKFKSGIESEMARQVLDKLQQAGKVNESIQVIEAVARKSRDIGQQMQLLKQWSKFTPEGMQKWAVNTFKKADMNVDAKLVDQLGKDIKNINTASTEELADMVSKKVGRKIKKVDDIVDNFLTDAQLEKIATGKVNDKTAIELLQKQVDKLDIKVAKESLEKLVSDLKQIEKLDEKQLKELVKNTLVNDGVSIKTATNASKMYNFEELKALNTAVAMGKVMDKIPITVSKKMATFQAMQYLLNARTFNRNLRGNLGSVIGEQINKLPSAGFDRLIGLKTGQRGVVAEIPQWTKEFDKIKEGFNQGKKSAYEIKLGIGRGNTGKYEALFGQAFKNKGIQKPLAMGEKLLRYSLETPDEFFKGWMAADSLYTSVRARLGNSVRKLSLDDVVNKATMDEVREAADYARYVTFQNDSYLANFLSNTKRALNKGTGEFITRFVPQAKSILNSDFGLGNLVVPFTRVPGNIITRGLEYSPLGYLESTRDIAKLFKASGEVPVAFQRQLSQKLGRATTGTGIIYTGMYLANKGIITGNSGTDNFDKSALDRSQGSGGYKINLSALNRLISGKSTKWQEGDNIHSYSGVEPFSVPLAVGAKIASELKTEEQKELYKVDNFKKALDAGANATWEETLDLPSLYTVKKMFFESMDKTNPDGTDKEGLDNFTSVMSVPLKEAIPGLTIPSWMRQIAQTVDPVMRETRGDNQIVDKIISNVPFLSKTLPPKLDPLGKIQKRKEGLVSNLVSPSFETKFKPIPFAEELDKVANKTEGNIYPSRKAPNSFSYRGETLTLTPKEKQEWLKIQGGIVAEQYGKLLKSVNVDTISQEQLDELSKQLESIKSEARERAKFELLKKRGIK